VNNDQIELSVGIVNTNNRDMLKDCLQSIYDTVKKTRFEIVVADNSSTDGSVEMMREHFPEVKIVSVEPRNGYGFCQNRAYEKSQGKYFLVFNEDMYVFPDALDNMMDIIKKDETIGALGCKTLNKDRTVRDNYFHFPTMFSILFDNLVPATFILPNSKFRARYFWGSYDEAKDVDVISGCVILIPREVIEKIGLFDEQFFLYSDEVDLCKRIWNGGWRVHYTPEGEIIHYAGQTAKTMQVKSSIIQLQSKFKYFKKHHSTVQAYIVNMSYIVGIFIRIVGWNIAKILRLKDKQQAEGNIKTYWKVLLWLLGFNRS